MPSLRTLPILAFLLVACGDDPDSPADPGASAGQPRGGSYGSSGQNGASAGGQGAAAGASEGGSSQGGAGLAGAGGSGSGGAAAGGQAGAGAGQGGAGSGGAGAAGAGAAGAGQAGAAGAGAGCLEPHDTRNLGSVNGLNTKWRTYSARLLDKTGYLSSSTPGDSDTRVTVQPDQGGMSPVAWLKALGGLKTGSKKLNRLMLNLDPASLYASQSDPDRISDEDWAAYKSAALKDRLALGTDELKLLAKLQKSIDKNRFTVAQRNGLLLAFIEALEAGPGGVCAPDAALERRIPFLLHQRKYIHEKPQVNSEDEDQFADEMSDFINRVLDHDEKNGTRLQDWIAGVRLGENRSPDPKQWKASVLYMVKRINQNTGGFLKKRQVIANGPRMGSDYRVKDGNKVISVDDDLATDDFIPKMADETHSFAVGYKFMADEGTMGSNLAATTCPGNKPCDPASPGDWKYFLDLKGFDALAKYVNHFYPGYPKHSNVVWVGDSGDAMATLCAGDKPEADYQAVSSLFSAAPGDPSWSNFRGSLFMESNSSEIDFENPTKSHDTCKYMIYANGSGTWPTLETSSPLDWTPAIDHSFELNSATIQLWSGWPAMP